MASRRGPVPKPDARRARHGSAGPTPRAVVLTPVAAPELPADVLPAGIDWHPATRRWWRAWQESPLTDHLSEVEWAELITAALLHHAIHADGDLRLAPELRRRIGAYGATAEDRARLHLTTAEADAKEARAGQAVTARQRYGNVRALTAAPGTDGQEPA